jgi:Domain of unknown function (DUF4124)
MIKLKQRLLLCAALTLCFPVSAKTYKWVDDQGVTHIGDTIPAKYADKDRTELNTTGRTVKQKEVLTAEERLAREAEDARIQADLATVRNKKIHDSSLINTYSNVTEIDLARARNLQQIEARAQIANKQLADANKSLAELKTKADGLTQTGKAVPPYLKQEIDGALVRIAKLGRDLAAINAEKATLESRYDADKARYKELTGN